MPKTTVATVNAQVQEIVQILNVLVPAVQALSEASPAEAKPKPKAAKPKGVPTSARAAKRARNQKAHRSFLAYYGKGNHAAALKAIPSAWHESEFYATRLAEIA